MLIIICIYVEMQFIKYIGQARLMKLIVRLYHFRRGEMTYLSGVITGPLSEQCPFGGNTSTRLA